MKRMIKYVLSSQQLESDDLILSKAAIMVRQQIPNRQGFKFNGQFSSRYQQESVPPQLLDLISMELNGTSIQDQESEVSQACLTITQLILFHSKKRKNSSETKTVRHSHEREPPLPIYIGLYVHTQTRSKTLVNTLYCLGLSISYNRVEELANGLATGVCN